MGVNLALGEMLNLLWAKSKRIGRYFIVENGRMLNNPSVHIGQRTLTVRGSLTALHVSSFTSLDSTDSLHTYK